MTTPTKPKTIGQLCDAYVAALKDLGKSQSTAKSYAGDLALAKKHFGEDTALTKITNKDVEVFFGSNAVTLTRKGAPKNKITSDKIRRVFRLAMAWAEAEGFIKESPVEEKKKTEKKEATKATSSKPPVLKKPAKGKDNKKNTKEEK